MATADDSKKRLISALIAAGEVYNRKISPALLEIYWQALKGYPIGDVLEALGRHLSDPEIGQYMPKPADVVRQIGGDPEIQGVKAWAQVLDAVRRVGAYQSVVFDDWRIHVCIRDLGGWQSLCHMDVESYPFRQKDFVARFKACRQGEQYPARMAGITEQHNEAHGYLKHVPAPLLLGDESKAREVFRLGRDADRVRLLPIAPAKYLPPPQQPETDWDAMPDEEAQAKVGEIISKLAAKLSAPKEDKPA